MLRKTLTLISLGRPFSSISLKPSPKTLTPHQKSSFESTLHHSLITHDTDQAWKVFRSFAAASSLPDKRLLNSLITHLSSFHHADQNTSLRHRLKRAFVSTTYVIEKDPILLEFETIRTVLESMKLAKASGPALALVECMFKNRYFVPFDLWGHLIIDICRENGSLAAFLKVFRESCRIAVDEKLDFMKPDLVIMTGLLENQRPELMAEFVEEVVEDPLVEVKSHDWNSIIHAFCKSGRLEDAKSTFRRMAFLQYEPNNQTYLSLINGYVSCEKYFEVVVLWKEFKDKNAKLEHALADAFLNALVKGGFFGTALQVIEKCQEMKIFVDKWRYKATFMETQKNLRLPKLRKRKIKKMELLDAFKNWVGLTT